MRSPLQDLVVAPTLNPSSLAVATAGLALIAFQTLELACLTPLILISNPSSTVKALRVLRTISTLCLFRFRTGVSLVPNSRNLCISPLGNGTFVRERRFEGQFLWCAYGGFVRGAAQKSGGGRKCNGNFCHAPRSSSKCKVKKRRAVNLKEWQRCAQSQNISRRLYYCMCDVEEEKRGNFKASAIALSDDSY